VIQSQAMLTIWRRHTASCPHRDRGREYLKCNCPLWADGYIDGRRTLRQSLKTRDMARARLRAVALQESDTLGSKPLREAVEAYLLNCQHMVESVQRNYRNRLANHLLPFCEGLGIEYLHQLDVSARGVETLDSFRVQRRAPAGTTLAGTTAARELETLRQFFGFCVERGWLKENPAKRIKTPRNIKPKPVVPYTHEELERILAAAARISGGEYARRRVKAAVLMLRHTALRISDVTMLERSQVQDSHLLLHTKKTGATVLLPLPSEVLTALKAVPTPRGVDGGTSKHFFVNGESSPRTAIRGMAQSLDAVFKASGVANARAHRFRHTLATDILSAGGTMRDVADVLGITEAVAEKHYAKWNVNRQERISQVMLAVREGTKRAHGKRLVVIK